MLPLKTRRRAPRDLIPAPPRGGRFRVGSYAGVTGARPSLVTCGQNGFLRRVQRQKFSSSAKMLRAGGGQKRVQTVYTVCSYKDAIF